MLFHHDAPFEYALIDLASDVAANTVPPVNPLPCDRWVARSALQKAIRRAEPALAVRALANLFEHERRGTWRSLAIIALEDVGVANLDILARIVAAYRDRKWRQQAGGDWPVMAEIVRQMATSEHCQAACDLLLRAVNDPALEAQRLTMLETDPSTIARSLWDGSISLLQRGIGALGMGGGLAEGQRHHDACAVFDILAESSRSSHVIATCRAAWKLTRNPMALLLPLIWERWVSLSSLREMQDDPLPPVHMIGPVPGFALDQFTRIGNGVSRALLRTMPELSTLFDTAGISRAERQQAIGDALFLIEGGALRQRATWPLGNALRLPVRMLPAVAACRKLDPILTLIASKAREIALLRQQHFNRAQATKA